MRYNTNIYQRPVVGFICVLLIFSSVSFVAAVQPGEIPLIGLNLSGMGMGQTLGETDVNISEAEIALSLLTLTAGYTATYYDNWNTFANLSVGSTSNEKTMTLEEFSAAAMYGGELTDRWSYFAIASGSRAAERDADDAYWNGMFGGAAVYALSERWNLVGGAGVIYSSAPDIEGLTDILDTDIEILPTPVFGVQWNQQAESGFAVSVILPVEATISYISPDGKFTSSVNVIGTEAELSYQFTPRFSTTLSATLVDGMLHRLAKDNRILPAGTSEAYLQSERSRVDLMFGANFFDCMSFRIGPYYVFDAEISVLDHKGKSLHKLAGDDAFGGQFALSLAF